MRRLAPTLLFFVWLVGCGDTGRERVSVPVLAAGTAARPVTIGDATVTLTRADVAFGPLYFCASLSGRAELCEVAVAELLPVVLLPALDPVPHAVGMLDATTGNIASAIYDYGISWLLTQNAVSASPLAPGGHSAVLEGTVVQGGRTLRFRAAIDAQPRVRGDLTVNGQRTLHTLTGGNEQLTLTLDPNLWVDRLDVAALFAADTDGDGNVMIQTPTGTAAADAGVADAGAGTSGTTDSSYESILLGMLTRAPLGFTWE